MYRLPSFLLLLPLLSLLPSVLLLLPLLLLSQAMSPSMPKKAAGGCSCAAVAAVGGRRELRTDRLSLMKQKRTALKRRQGIRRMRMYLC